MTVDICPELAAIIMPGTDDDIVESYASLAARARVRTFGLVEDDVVVIDTETTGLDFKESELIEVAAARLRGNQIVDTFDRFVKPAKPIPAEVVAITGITDEMVADADDAATVMADFLEFAGDTPLIAHCASFDRHFTTKGNGGRPVGSAWIDSLEFSRIVLPCLSSYKLHDLSRAFELHQSTHRAIDDVIATCGLWRVLLTAATDLPAGLLNQYVGMYPQTEWAYRPIFAQLALQKTQVPFHLLDHRAERCAKVDLAPRRDAFAVVEEGGMRFPRPDEVEREFGRGGIVGRMYEDYEPREEQVQMAREVARSFMQGSKTAIEAGTGVGKSIAYLLPAAMLARRNGITVGVATKSNALSDQLINHELPLLAAAMDVPLTYMALKGFDNYPCLRKVERLVRRGLSKAAREDGLAAAGQGELAGLAADGAGGEGFGAAGAAGGADGAGAAGAAGAADGDQGDSRRLPEPSEDLLDALAAVMSYSVQSAQGDINCLGIHWGKVQRSDLTSSSVECQKRHCPYFPNKCFLHLARRRAAACDVVVTNHSLLYRQIGSDVEILPPVRYWVVDEAHSAESEARRQWALRVNSREVAAAFDMMGGTTTGAIGTLFREARTKPAATLMLGLLSKTASECSRANIASGLFFDDLKAYCRKKLRARGTFDTETMWLDAAARAESVFAPVVQSGTTFASLLSEAMVTAHDAVRSLAEACQPDQGLMDRLNELTGAIGELDAIARSLQIILEGTDASYVYSAAATQKTGFEAYELTAECMDVGSRLNEVWHPQIASAVYSSATIAVGEKFDHFAHQVGLDLLPHGEFRSLRLDSSYDFQNNMQVVVADGLPDPTKQKDAYLQALAPLLVDIHLAMEGSVLTLFTSRAEMEATYELVQPELARHGLELCMQSRGSNTRRLREHFVAEQKSSLFALKSFWEGFDARGDTLRCVVVPKLPFVPPTDPLSLERRLREGRDSWRNHDLPESVLTLKQAAGRLIRSSTDTGCLVLADPRLTSMWYGKVFLSSLPKKDYDVVPAAGVGGAIEAWRRG